MASEVAAAAAASEIPAEAPPATAQPPHKLERQWAFWFDNQSKPKQGAAWGSSLRKVYSFDTVEEFWCAQRFAFWPHCYILELTLVPPRVKMCFTGHWTTKRPFSVSPITPGQFLHNLGSYQTSNFPVNSDASTSQDTQQSNVPSLISPGPFSVEYASLYDQIFRPSKFPANADFHLFRAGVEPKWEDPECANGGKWTVMSSKKSDLESMWLETLMALIGEQFDDTEEICGVVASVRQRQDKLSLWTKTASNEAVQMGIGRKWKEIIDVTDKISFSFHDDSRRERSTKSRYAV
ncbi:hypothetical protein BUALT_Bualt12G0146700 [Buddleja alternifolia]|uniref:Eukaryotic translation initiation factor isoform 4E n=1 Tax=Buddleja alternifolia TaxID=168488 RepID=A0AAV6WZF6_9LAMI|nr:hypothetical protein BUALT_Bualt12G0146700 [Buddleja alternifolia]